MKSITQSLLFFLAMGVFFHPACADESPNILFIAIDDLRDWVGHLGFNSQVKTPNIDRLKHGLLQPGTLCSTTLQSFANQPPDGNRTVSIRSLWKWRKTPGSTAQRDHSDAALS